jgi:multiple sugar transport system substrate-binding protein
MRKIVALFIVLMMVFGVSLFAGGTEEKVAEKTTLTVWFGRDNFIPTDNFNSFKKQYPNITVEAEVVPLEEAATEFMRYHQSGLGPDIFQTFYTQIEVLDGRNTLYDMTPYFKVWKESDPEDYNDLTPLAIKGATTQDGKIVGINMVDSGSAMVYRKDWFNELGLDVPKTKSELIETAKMIRDSGILSSGQYPLSIIGGSGVSAHIWVNARFWRFGGEHTDTGLPIFDSKAGIETIDFYQTAMREKLADPEVISWGMGEYRGAFIGGNAAITTDTFGWHVMNAVQEELKYNEHWGVGAPAAPWLEGAKDKASVYADPYPYFVSSITDHPEDAMKIIRYLADKEISKEVGMRYQPAARLSFIEDPEVNAEKPWIADMMEHVLIKGVPPIHRNQDQVNIIMVDAMQEALQNPNVDPEDIVAKYQQRLNEID